MLAILSPILVFGLVIFVHELGHFIAAKAVGVYAPRFSIGFGPALFRKRRGETEYVLAILPLGGYVRMASRHDAETAFLEGGNEEQNARTVNDAGYDPNAMIPFGPKPVPENRWFESKPLWARIVIMIAGVVMNILLAVVVAIGLVFHYGHYDYPTTTIGSVQAPTGAPQLAQLQPGDSIRAVNGVAVKTWGAFQKQVLVSSHQVVFTTQRGDVTVPITSSASAEDIAEGLVLFIPPVIDSVVEGDRAAAAGFQHGDSITSVGGLMVRSWPEVTAEVRKSAEKPISFVVRRGSSIDTILVTPKSVTERNPVTGVEEHFGRIGASPKVATVRIAVEFRQAVSDGFQLTLSDAGTVFKILKQIGTGATSVRELGGPIAITRASVSAARSGLDELFRLIALLSINVAVLNLLPIPILDGGQILINVLESAKGSPFSLKTRDYILRFGLVAIGLLFAIVMYNDTRAGFASLFGWLGKVFGV